MKASDLMRDLGLLKMGWHRQENPETEAVAIFCNTAKNEAEWEASAIAQAQTVERDWLTSLPEPKPLETGILRNMTTRGD